MKNIVILNASGLTEYALLDSGNGKTSIKCAVEAALKMPDISAKAAIVGSECSCTENLSGFTLKEPGNGAVSGLIQALTELSEGFDNIFYFYADCPLIDTALAGRMYENHLKYFSEYTFADGYPAGLSVEIIKTSILPLVAKLDDGNDDPVERRSVFSLIEKDINSFDIETEISPDDQRLLRLSLFPDTRRNYMQLKKLMSIINKDGTPASGDEGFSASVLQTVRNRGDIFRTLPVFFEIETTGGLPQSVSYLPKSENKEGEMSSDDFLKCLSKISEFTQDAVISLSIRNEPAAHSMVSDLVAAVLEYPDFSLLIETSGIGWSDGEVDRILGMDGRRMTWIVDLDALDPGLYSRLRGDGRDEAFLFTDRMLKKSPENVWVQAVRMKENEEDMEQFYKYWKERTNNVIIQKYDWCCGKLPQRKVTDLSPVKRLPCWHLKREMIILTDGSVPVCRDDLEKEMVLGNILTDKIETIWQNGQQYYRQHLSEEYPELCRNCDEYYTYNY